MQNSVSKTVDVEGTDHSSAKQSIPAPIKNRSSSAKNKSVSGMPRKSSWIAELQEKLEASKLIGPQVENLAGTTKLPRSTSKGTRNKRQSEAKKLSLKTTSNLRIHCAVTRCLQWMHQILKKKQLSR